MERKLALLVMQRKALADAFAQFAKGEVRFDVKLEQHYAMAALTAEACAPAIVMLEIPESGPWKSAEKCLALCDVMKRQASRRKIIVLCPEGDADSCGAVIAAKRAHRIDDFLYYDTSMEYLFSKLKFFAE